MSPDLTPASWMTDALCAQIGIPADAWFPEIGDNSSQIKAICHECPVRAACRDLADELEGTSLHTLHGIFGGESPGQRYRRRKAVA